MFTRLHLENWKNFRQVDVRLGRRTFIVGPNASGKSNLLDAFRFLRDLAVPQGGLQVAVNDSRRGISHIRSLHARKHSVVIVEVEADLSSEGRFVYRLEISQDNNRNPKVQKESVKLKNETILERPTEDDKKDATLLTQTHLEQVTTNKRFRPLADFFSSIRYLHVVPQLIRDPERSREKKGDPFGGDFLDQLASAPKKALESRLHKIQEALRVAVPQLKELKCIRDERGVPHLEGLYEHWRPKAGWQREDQFSDGTLRLLGLLWSLLDGSAPLLLEEPELSLNPGVVRHLPQLMTRLVRKSGRQLFVSTHSSEILSDKGIRGGENIILLTPTKDGTTAKVAADLPEIRALLEAGLAPSDAVLPRTLPKDANQLALFDG